MLKLWEKTLAFGLCFAILYSVSAQASREQVADKLIRLHVVANSDSREDQALKLKVRDRIIADFFTNDLPSDKEKCEAYIRESLPEIQKSSLEVVRAEGYDYKVRVSLGNRDIPEKDYGSFALPAGTYEALTVKIGSGEGRNWWCVIFPPLCLAPATQVREKAASAGLNNKEIGLITSDGVKVKVKFKILEWIDAFKGWLGK